MLTISWIGRNSPYLIIKQLMYGSKNCSYVYKLTNVETGEFYIGMRSCWCLPEDDKYYGSGIRITHCIKKFGKEKFKKEILKTFLERKEASNYEEEILNEEVLKNPLCLNLKTGGEYERDYKYTDEVRKQISEARKEWFKNPENVKKQSEAIKKAYKDDETLALRISKVKKENCNSVEFKNKMSVIRNEMLKDEKFRQKIKDSINSIESLEKKSKSIKKYLSTEIGKQNASEATKNKIYINKNGITKRITKEQINEYLDLGWILGKGYVVQNETKNKLSKVSKNKKWMFNLELKQNKRIAPENVDEMLMIGWQLGHRKF
jgi:hypothetical protein